MPSSNRVSWQLFLVFTIWICAVLVRPFAGDNNVLLFTTRLSGSIDGSRASNSNLRPGIPPASSSRGVSSHSSREEVPDGIASIDGQNQRRIFLSTSELYPSPRLDSIRSKNLFSGLPATIKWTQTSFLQIIPRRSLGPAKSLVRTISRSITRLSTAASQQQDQNHNISTAYLVAPTYTPPPHADQIDQQTFQSHVSADNQSCTTPPSDQFPPRLELETSTPQSQTSPPSLKASITDLLQNVAGFSTIKTNNHPNPRRRDNNLSSSALEPSELPDTTTSEKGPSSGRTAAERSCLGLVIGLVVAIVWL